MPKAVWNGAILAESTKTEVIEGNHYFPPESIHREYFVESDARTTCPWKGQARYYTIEVEGKRNEDAAWYYPEPREAAHAIRNHVAFWKGVEVTE